MSHLSTPPGNQAASASAARRHAAVARLGERALSGIEIATLMEESVALLAETLEVEYAKVLELLPGEEALLLRAGVGWKEGLVGRATVGAAKDSQAGYTLLSSEPVIVEDLRTETRFSGPPLLDDHGVVSGMSVIIHGKDHPFGVLGVHTGSQRTFSSGDIDFLQSIANILALAIERRRAEEALRESEEQYRRMVATANEGIWVVDTEGKVVFANSRLAEMLGYSTDELVGAPVFALTDEEWHATAEAKLERCRRGIKERRDFKFRRRDGADLWVILSTTPVFDKQGQYVGGLGMLTDITERRQAEAALHVRERQQAVVTQLGQRALTGTDLSTLMDEAMVLVAQTLNVDYAKVLELLPSGEALLLRAGVGWKEGLVGQTTVSAGSHSQAGYTLLSSEPVIVEDLRAETRFSGPQLLHDHAVVSGVSVIIHGRERPFGVLGVHAIRRHTFTQDDVNFVQAVANVLAAAIERKQAEDALQRAHDELEMRVAVRTAELGEANEELQAQSEEIQSQKEELEAQNEELTAVNYMLSESNRRSSALASIAMHLNAGRSLSEVMQTALTEMTACLGGEDGSLFLFEDDGRHLRGGLEVWAGDRTGLVVDIDEWPRRKQVVETGKPAYVALPETEGTERAWYEKLGIWGSIISPLVVEDRCIGLLLVNFLRESYVPPSEDITFAGQLAGQCALAIDRAGAQEERERLLQQQQEDRQRMEEMLRLIAHDVRQPITVAGGHAQLLHRSLARSDIERARISAEAIEVSIRRLDSMVQDLVDSTKLEVGQLQLEKRPLDVVQFVHDALGRLSVALDVSRVRAESTCPVAVLADPNRLERVLGNLVSNALKYSSPGTPIAVRIEERDGAGLIAVKDHGPGISPHDLPNLFNRGYRAMTAQKEDGLGLGLYITRLLVEAHGGRIWVESEPGQGSTFYVTVPLA